MLCVGETGESNYGITLLCNPLSADEWRWMFHAPQLLPLFALYSVQPCCALLPNSCVLRTLVFRPRSVHRKPIVAMPSGRPRVWRKVYIHPNSTKLSFNPVLTFSLSSVCTLGRTPSLHVQYMLCYLRDLTNAWHLCRSEKCKIYQLIWWKTMLQRSLCLGQIG